MLIASHSLVSGYVGEKLGNPFLAFLVGIMLHFILDAIPHYDTTDKGKMTLRQILLIVVDGLIGFWIVCLYCSKMGLNYSFIAGVIGGLLPDIFDNSPLWSKKFRNTKHGHKLHQLHQAMHGKQFSAILGILIQIAIITYFAILLLR